MTRARRLPVVFGFVAAGATFAGVSALDGQDTPAAGRPTVATSPATQGRAVFARLACGSCHKLTAAGAPGDIGIGPDLDQRLPAHTRTSLRAQILGPPNAGTMGAMPSLAERVSDADLEALITYLLDAGGAEPAVSAPG